MSKLIYSYRVNDRVNSCCENMIEAIESKAIEITPEEDYVIYVFSKYVKNMTRDRFGRTVSWDLVSFGNSYYSIVYRYWKPTENPDNGYEEINGIDNFIYYEDTISNTLKSLLLNIRYFIDRDVSWLERKQKEESDARKDSTEGKKRRKKKVQDTVEMPESEQ